MKLAVLVAQYLSSGSYQAESATTGAGSADVRLAMGASGDSVAHAVQAAMAARSGALRTAAKSVAAWAVMRQLQCVLRARGLTQAFTQLEVRECRCAHAMGVCRAAR